MKRPPLNPHGLPTQTELLPLLLETIEEAGGELRPFEAMERLAGKLGIPPELRDLAVESGRGRWSGRLRYVWRNRVAWVRLNAVRRDYIDPSTPKMWRITKKARHDLANIRPGIVLKIYETASGTALWATAEAAAGVIADGSINLIFLSPAYALTRPKRYGNPRSTAEYIQWLVNLGREWRRMLVENGSLVMNVGAAWVPGQPCQSEYQERLLLAFLDELQFSLAQRLTYYNPAKLPTSPWVTQQRIRLNVADEAVYWLGKSPNPYANVRELLRPYSDTHTARLRAGKVSPQGKPSAPDSHSRGSSRFIDCGGAIPHSILTIANSNASDAYLQSCREFGIEPNGARMPPELASQIIKLTTREGDVVYDPMAGSNVVGFMAEKLGRRWLASDRSLTYMAGSAGRFHPGSVAFNESVFEAFEAPV